MPNVVIVLTALFLVVVLLTAVIARAHGRLTSLRNVLQNAFARVEEQFARRHGLVRTLLDRIPEEDREAVAAVTAACDRAEEAGRRAGESAGDERAIETVLKAEAELAEGLEGLGKHLGDEGDPREDLENARDRVDFACEAFNETVAAYGEYRGRFPGSLVARLFGFPEVGPVDTKRGTSAKE